jgi:hypothetical protein
VHKFTKPQKPATCEEMGDSDIHLMSMLLMRRTHKEQLSNIPSLPLAVRKRGEKMKYTKVRTNSSYEN